MAKRRRQQRASVPRIGTKGPTLGDVMPKANARVALVDYKARDANPADWFTIMTRADTGDTGPMIDIFSDARDRDSHLDGVISKRVSSMMGRPIVFRPPDYAEGDGEATDVAKRVTRILLSESLKFRAMLAHLMTGAAYGYSVAKLDWTTNARGEYVPHMEEAHPNRFAFDRDTLKIGFYKTAYRTATQIAPLSEYPDRFVAHVPMGGRSDYPWRRGPVRSCIIPSFIKRNGLQFWLTLAERFGMPQPYATVPEGADHDGESSDDTVATVQEALQNLGRYWSMVVTKGVEINAIPGAGNVSADVHRGLIDWAEMTESIALLGQNLTTKVDGGSFAATDAHRAVAADIHLADAVELSETITQQVVEPLVRYNWPGAPVPVCQISTGQRQTPTVEMVQAGIFSADEMRREMGFDARTDPQPTPRPAQPGAQS